MCELGDRVRIGDEEGVIVTHRTGVVEQWMDQVNGGSFGVVRVRLDSGEIRTYAIGSVTNLTKGG